MVNQSIHVTLLSIKRIHLEFPTKIIRQRFIRCSADEIKTSRQNSIGAGVSMEIGGKISFWLVFFSTSEDITSCYFFSWWTVALIVVVACNRGLLDYSIQVLFGLGDYWMLPLIHTSPALGFTTIQGCFSIVLRSWFLLSETLNQCSSCYKTPYLHGPYMCEFWSSAGAALLEWLAWILLAQLAAAEEHGDELTKWNEGVSFITRMTSGSSCMLKWKWYILVWERTVVINNLNSLWDHIWSNGTI
jgi:hypothetical protein